MRSGAIRDGWVLEKKGRKFSRIPVNKYSPRALISRKGGEKQVFDWAIFLKIIIAIFQAILQNLPVV